MNLYRHLRACVRLARFLFFILMYFAKAIFITWRVQDPIERRKRLIKNGQFYSRLIVKSFNVEIICKNPVPENENSLLVGNHVGFIDIVTLFAVCDSVFITSLEMKNTPGLGQICDLGGCAYVDRKNRMNLHEELRGITDVLKQGFRIVLYAESVASNGEQVLPFKKTLMMAAGLAETPLRPFVFNFRKVNGGPVLYEHRDSLCWYGKQTFLPAIWRSMHLDSAVCEIPKPDEDRTALSKKVHDMVSEKFVPFKPGMNAEAVPQASSKILTHSL
jgi:lyso-ornithine lipid O-acyltransferase